ncbi:unnamed protein product [Pieris brassicae]|uniref:Uncharacterized protein n=1 Tax=Pieris brassicae TaxID=7116 RepID=A0A9P0TMT3_PIEBR|nr:unnamed protein product [Pieris brassicae]
MAWDLTLDFEYVVTKKTQPRMCFGTTLNREVLPTKGPNLSPFMRRNAGEIRPNLGPGVYENDRDAFYDLTHRIYSKLYFGPKSPRWKAKHEYQPPPKEPPPAEEMHKNCAPFNSTSKRKGLFSANDYPAACDYYPIYKKNEMKFSYCFNGKKTLKCAVESIRDCFFAHAHNSCKAALKIMKIEEIEKKLRKEAYLDLYFPQRRYCNN